MRRRHIAVVVPLLFLLLSGLAHAREYTREFTFDTDDLKVVNMIGAIEVVEAAGSAFKITVSVRGDDASEDFLDIATLDEGGDVLAIRFPTKDYQKYVYPPLGGNSKTTIHYHNEGEHGNSWLKKVFSGLSGTKVTVRGRGRGKEVWADVKIAVPRDAELEVRLGVGEISASALAADLNLDTNSGKIEMHDIRGDVLADTGSGRVVAVGIDGEVNIDTGSGSVEVRDCDGAEIKVDTGSGRVVGEDLSCDNLLIDTGSGTVKVRQVKTDRALIDTGSGSVHLQLDRMGDGRFVIDTGSGSIKLSLPENASARITADTGSGSVLNDYPDADVVHKERREMELILGEGDASVRLDAGSGSIEVRQN